MKRFNREVGRVGEREAERYLTNKGYEITERNFASKFGEIDLICRDGETWVFVEVKTKKGEDFGTPEEMFSWGKYQKVKRMAIVYLNGKEEVCRIDMVAVQLDGGDIVTDIRHYENVVY